MSFTSKLVTSGANAVYFVTYKDKDNEDIHCFLRSSAAKIASFLQEQTGTFDIREYGEILACGFGKKPSGLTRFIMQTKYKIDVEG